LSGCQVALFFSFGLYSVASCQSPAALFKLSLPLKQEDMSHFDASAREWDSNPGHWERSEAIAKAILEEVPLQPEMKALEFGAGTGILSFLLESQFSEITLMDSSGEMVKVMHEKVARTGLNHLKPLFFDLEADDFTDCTFDCIYTQMAMHHVGDIEKVVNRFYRLLDSGGWLAIADLYKEEGSFHGDGFTGHMGFEPEQLQNTLEKAGFGHVTTRPCFVLRKMINTNWQEFPVFLMTAQKPIIQ
jgi:tRNA (cmo5U34)-methyltransferase